MNNIPTHAYLTMDLASKPWEEVQTSPAHLHNDPPVWILGVAIMVGFLVYRRFQHAFQNNS